jgi:GNAT superfamily N-acetyltransferase
MLDTASELDRADRLLMTAYNGPSRRRELSRYLAVQPDGWFVIADGDDAAAIAGPSLTAASAGSGWWPPTPRVRQGLATTLSAQLVRWARERGCATVVLDASDAGRPVYERLGFRALGHTVELALPSAPPTGGRSPRVSTLLAMGLSEQRRLTHMRLGQPALPGERRLLLAQAS